jgi:hypothetical protein
MSGPKAGDRKLKKTASCDAYAPFAMMMMMIPGWIRWTGHVACMR